ncbi:MAG: DUF4403 family protein [Sneathiella sp.]
MKKEVKVLLYKYLMVFIGIFLSVIGNAHAEDISSISVPIRINLKSLEGRINSDIPQRIANINERGLVCVKAKWLVTDIPVGVEIYDIYKTRVINKTVKTIVAPEVKCDVSGWINRNGKIGLTGNGQSIHLSFPLAARVSAEAIGISETAEARATIFANITPDITSDWNVSAKVSPNMRWDQTPTLELFGIIKVTIANLVEPELRSKIGEFAKKVPQLLSGLNIRSKIEKAWVEIQKPIQISKKPSIYLVFQPVSVGFSGISIVDNVLNAQVKISGTTSVTVGATPTTKQMQLLPLQQTEMNNGEFNFNLPTFASFLEIEKAANEQFPDGHNVEIPDGNLKGSLHLDNLKISKADDKGKIRLSINVDYDNRSNFVRFIDIFDWFDMSGKISFNALPKIDTEKNVVHVEDLILESEASNPLLNTLAELGSLPYIRSYIESIVKYDYSSDLKAGISAANKSINVDLPSGVKVSGEIKATNLSNVKIQEKAISLIAEARGIMKVDIDL